MFLPLFFFVMKLWLRIPLVKPDDDSLDTNSDTSVSKYAKIMPGRSSLLCVAGPGSYIVSLEALHTDGSITTDA